VAQGERIVKFSMKFGALEGFGHKMLNFKGNIGQALKNNDDMYAQKLLASVIRHASGRPGPNIVSGEYVRSFVLVENKVVNPSPQTARLEYGYQGVDSAGRSYSQPPFPHFRPALMEVRREYARGIVTTIRNTWRGS
jgi:hypothetical protein